MSNNFPSNPLDKAMGPIQIDSTSNKENISQEQTKQIAQPPTVKKNPYDGQCWIISVKSANQIYLRPLLLKQVLEEMGKSMLVAYNQGISHKLAKNPIEPGEMCLVKNEKSGKISRCKVAAVLNDETENESIDLLVNFIDYGSIDRCAKQDLVFVNAFEWQVVFNEPPLVLCCKLKLDDSMVFANDENESQLLQSILTMTPCGVAQDENSSIRCEMTGNQDDLKICGNNCQVTLYYPDVCASVNRFYTDLWKNAKIEEKNIKMNYICEALVELEWREISQGRRGQICDPIQYGDFVERVLQKAASLKKDNPRQAERRARDPSVHSESSSDSEESGDEMENFDYNPEHDFYSFDPHSQFEDSFDFSPSSPEIEEYSVVHVESLNKIFVRNERQSRDLLDITKMLQCRFKKASFPELAEEFLTIRQSCLTQIESVVKPNKKMWVRCQILKLNQEEKTAEVLLYDFGHTVTIPSQKLLLCPSDLHFVSPCVYKVSLADSPVLGPTTEAALKKFLLPSSQCAIDHFLTSPKTGLALKKFSMRIESRQPARVTIIIIDQKQEK